MRQEQARSALAASDQVPLSPPVPVSFQLPDTAPNLLMVPVKARVP